MQVHLFPHPYPPGQSAILVGNCSCPEVTIRSPAEGAVSQNHYSKHRRKIHQMATHRPLLLPWQWPLLSPWQPAAGSRGRGSATSGSSGRGQVDQQHDPPREWHHRECPNRVQPCLRRPTQSHWTKWRPQRPTLNCTKTRNNMTRGAKHLLCVNLKSQHY